MFKMSNMSKMSNRTHCRAHAETYKQSSKLLPNMVLFSNTICIFQQLVMFFNDFFSWTIVCKDIEPKYERNKAKDFVT